MIAMGRRSRRGALTALLALMLTLEMAVLFPYRPVLVLGSSMRPSLDNGQLVWLDRLCHGTDVRAGDVVLFKHKGETLVKRVAGAPGDLIEIAQFDNGLCRVPKDDRDRRTCRQLARNHPDMIQIAPYQVPSGCLFVLGDNETASIDSRDFGPIPASEVIGRVVPGSIHPLWDARTRAQRLVRGMLSALAFTG